MAQDGDRDAAVDVAGPAVAEELQRRRSELVAQLARLNAPREPGMAAIGFGKRAGDFTAIATEQEERAVTAEQLDHQLGVVDRAIAKLAEGSYGRCDDCGDAIGAARLEALPTAVRCLSCQAGSARSSRTTRGRR